MVKPNFGHLADNFCLCHGFAVDNNGYFLVGQVVENAGFL